MRKALILMTGLFVFTAVNVWAQFSIGPITVTGTNSTSGTVTISATLNNATPGLTNQVIFTTTSTNGFNRLNFPLDQVSGSGVWSNSSWNPYFVGDYVIDIIAYDFGSLPPAMATASTTVAVTRAESGTVNSIKYSSVPYEANGVWSNVDTSKVSLQNKVSIDPNSIVGGVGCNLLNVTNLTERMTPEQEDIAYTDTVAYKPAGTPYRFDVSLHARPRGFMGMGEIKRWIWAPADTNNPNGSGTLVVDITAVSPWRSSYSNALQSHVGFSPLFAEHSADMPTGVIMCTSAHYMDVGPTNTGTEADARVGLRVNGHTGTNSYLKTFLSDTFLQQQYQLTNVYDATNAMAGFVQHFNTNGVPIDDVTQVTASFIRIVGGTGTNLVYDYNFDGIGDSGYETRLDFEFHSAVAAQMGMASTNVSENAYSVLACDFDGDRLADPAVYNTNGTWKIKLSSGGYSLLTLAGFLGGSGYSAVAGDFDGDAKADPAVYETATGTWKIKLSSGGYSVLTLTGLLGGSDYAGYTALAGDFDGDGLADPAIYETSSGTWIIKLSTAGYTALTKPDFLGSAGYTGIAADFDGDGKVDPAIYEASTGSWIILLSASGYGTAALGAGFLGSTGYTALGADFDGDGLADPAVAQTSTGNWKIKLSSGSYSLLDLPGFLGE